MTIKLTDFEREPCQCTDCIVAGVSGRPQRRDPQSGRWLHGRELRRWWDARDAFLALKKTVAPKAMR